MNRMKSMSSSSSLSFYSSASSSLASRARPSPRSYISLLTFPSSLSSPYFHSFHHHHHHHHHHSHSHSSFHSRPLQHSSHSLHHHHHHHHHRFHQLHTSASRLANGVHGLASLSLFSSPPLHVPFTLHFAQTSSASASPSTSNPASLRLPHSRAHPLPRSLRQPHLLFADTPHNNNDTSDADPPNTDNSGAESGNSDGVSNDNNNDADDENNRKDDDIEKKGEIENEKESDVSRGEGKKGEDDNDDFENELVNDNEDPVYGGDNNNIDNTDGDADADADADVDDADEDAPTANSNQISSSASSAASSTAPSTSSSPSAATTSSSPSSSSSSSSSGGSVVPSVTYPPVTNYPLSARVEFRAYPQPPRLYAIPLHEVWLPGRYFNKTITHHSFRLLLRALATAKQPYIAFFRCKTEKELAVEKEESLKQQQQPQQQQQSEQSLLSESTSSSTAPTVSTSATTAATSSQSSTTNLLRTPQRINLNAPPMLSDPNLVHPMGVMLSFVILAETAHTISAQFLVIRRIRMKGSEWQNGELVGLVEHVDEESLEEIEAKGENYSKIVKAHYDTLVHGWAEYQRHVSSDTMRFIETREKQIQDTNVASLSVPGHFVDYVAGNCLDITQAESQTVLSTFPLQQRLLLVIDLLAREKQVNQIRERIQKMVAKKHNEKQNEHILKEQLTAIQKQLGVGKAAEKEKLLNKFRDRLKTRVLPAEVMKVIEEELSKFQALESESTEYSFTRNYLDWLTVMPWGVFTSDHFDINQAEQILNQDHYGLDDVKNRILEFIAVGQILRALPQGKILCLVGPPGVGKTSIGKSIARALGRKFYRMAVGGTDDVSEIKGHRRTYVGALPGKLIQGLKRTECANPVILIDEIDKIGRGWRGDPSAALLEVLDPEQNQAFTDHYLDVPVDLSKVLFICTANTDETIPGPLRDRMEFITLSGYVWKEKLDIAKNYLIPAIRTKTALTKDHVLISDDALSDLIRWYCREPGVRNLNKHIEKIFNKAALKIARSRPVPAIEAGTVKDKHAIHNIHQVCDQPITTTATVATSSSLQTSSTFVAATPIDNSPNSSTAASTAASADATPAATPAATPVTPASQSSSAASPPPTTSTTTAATTASTTIPPSTASTTTSSTETTATAATPIPSSLPLPLSPIRISTSNLAEYAGKRVFNTDRLYETLPIGVSMGLAWNSMGGTLIFVEATSSEKFVPAKSHKKEEKKTKRASNKGKAEADEVGEEEDEVAGGHGDLFTTGQLGDVMKESSLIAYTVAKQEMEKLQPHNKFFQRTRVHLHVPEGATPKDGPSAGITMVTALLSLSFNLSPANHIAMTGELALTGKVLPIGGVKEKILAARRGGVTDLIFPVDNQKDVDELQDFVKEGLSFHFVSKYEEVRRLVFPTLQLPLPPLPIVPTPVVKPKKLKHKSNTTASIPFTPSSPPIPTQPPQVNASSRRRV